MKNYILWQTIVIVKMHKGLAYAYPAHPTIKCCLDYLVSCHAGIATDVHRLATSVGGVSAPAL